jgi:hypothetical protein
VAARIGTIKSGTPRATVHPSVADLHWAAGFLEGDGCFIRSTPSKLNRSTERVMSRQNDREALERLQSFFGGRILTISQKSNRLAKQKVIYDWSVYGALARGVMMTLFGLMCEPRKRQIRAALTVGKSRFRMTAL